MDENYYLQRPCHTGVLWKWASKDEIIVSTHSFQSIRLTHLGSAIFERCNGKNTIREIIEYLMDKYQDATPNYLESKTYEFLYFLESLGVIIIYWDNF
jgi:hypothetical protein